MGFVAALVLGVAIHAAPGITAWETPGRYAEVGRADFSANGHRLNGWSQTGCVAYASGYNVVVRMNGCGRGRQHLRFKITNFGRKAVTVKIRLSGE